jgi:hypothetical protein
MMNTIKKLTILAIAVVFLALATHSFGYQAENRISLMATPQHPGANGTVVITDTHIEIEARGLKPDSVYTAWFVNTKPKKHEAGAGQPPYMFKTDSYGNGIYSAELSESPFGKWEMIMVVLHPTGDPKDMKNMVGALSAGIK